MARKSYRYSLNRRDAKLVGVCSTLGEIIGIDPTFLRIGFIALFILFSWEVALVTYAGLGIYFSIQRKRAAERGDRRSDYERMADSAETRSTVHAARTQLDETDRRLMAIDHHLNSHNDDLAREIDALREDK